MTRTAFVTTLVFFGLIAGTPSVSAETRKAIFAGGCFWCVEADFDKVPGVTATVSGYIGGSTDNPTYKNHAAAGHREAVEIAYDPGRVSYETLLAIFWRSVDPTDGGGQFCDRGYSYTTAIYTIGQAQADAARKSKTETIQALGEPVATEVVKAPAFWPAEDYHQDYYRKNPVRYKFYRNGCGRDDRIRQVWGGEAFEGIPGY
ncbi:MAG: peptide-methionine (S)-S-oxide reductase MsrA [Rhizobiaceae bacterium]|nr:peptide-methionine (S)-S-oxide reductase MsrA [Rhizobiaceae bacterium]MCV0407637.1 peptide-methionine (S)-S-oxide reductase MsrA [Rhizobiaceae bacterium]